MAENHLINMLKSLSRDEASFEVELDREDQALFEVELDPEEVLHLDLVEIVDDKLVVVEGVAIRVLHSSVDRFTERNHTTVRPGNNIIDDSLLPSGTVRPGITQQIINYYRAEPSALEII